MVPMSKRSPLSWTRFCRNCRMVVQPDGAGVVDAERVEEIGELELSEELHAAPAEQLGQLRVGQSFARLRRLDGEVVGHQRVHPIDRHELLGQRERHAMVFGRRSGNPRKDVVVRKLRKHVLQLAEPAVPVRPQASRQDVLRENRGRPFHGVNLGEQGRVDQARLLEQPLIVPFRVVLLEVIANRVVLECEQAVEQAQAHPAVLGEPGDLAAGHRVDAETAARAHEHLAIAAGAQRRLAGRAAAIDSRTVPPVRVLVDVGGRPLRPLDLGRVGGRLRHAHRPFVPGVAVVQGNVVGERPGALLVHEPVVDHELNPCRSDHIEDGGWLERGPREQLEADPPGTRRQEVGGVREGFAQRHIAAEPHAGASHTRTLQVVVGTVAGPHVVDVTARWRRRGLQGRLLGIGEILFPHLLAYLIQPDALSGPRKVVPIVGTFAHDRTPSVTEIDRRLPGRGQP